jgi:CBS-domain-containing membrane protein
MNTTPGSEKVRPPGQSTGQPARTSMVMRPTQVVAVRRSTPFKEMAAPLRQERVSAFPVVDDGGTVVGLVSETDLLPKETLDAGWAARIPEMTSRVLDEGGPRKGGIGHRR